MNNLSRRRFLTDMGFIGGALLLAAGTAMFAQHEGHSAAQTPTPEPNAPEPVPVNDRPNPGEMEVLPPTTPDNRPMPGAIAAPPPSPTPDLRGVPGKVMVDPGSRGKNGKACGQ